MKIYRAEICGSNDSCTEFWEFLPITPFYTSKEAAERTIADMKGLKGRALEDAIAMNRSKYNEARGAYFGDNQPKIEEYDVMEDIIPGGFGNFKKMRQDLATEAFWYIKKQVDERGQIHTEARHAGAVLEWDDCHRFPFVGIGVRGETMMFNDDWQAHVADDSEIIEIAVKLQEGQGNV